VAYLVGPTIVRAWSAFFQGPPSIDWFVSNHESHRAEFAKLSHMASVDPPFSLQMTERGAYLQDVGVRSSPSIPQVLTQARIKQYEAQLRPIGGVSMLSDAGDIHVMLGSAGLATGGAMWGYVHTKQPPADIVTLEQARTWPWYYALGDDWYAYVQ